MPTPTPTKTPVPGPVPTPNPTPTVPPQIITALVETEARVKDFRVLKPSSAPTRRFVTQQEMAQLVTSGNGDSGNAEHALDEEALYRLLGLIPADYDYLEGESEFLGSQIVGLYLHETNEILVVRDAVDDGALSINEEFIYAHEYTHLLQDAVLNSTDLYASLESSDQSQALRALIEGDATLASHLHIWNRQKPGLTLSADLIDDVFIFDPETVDPDVPYFLQRHFEFAYADGTAFVARLHRSGLPTPPPSAIREISRGGFPTVDHAYTQPPATTEQVIHFEKYLAHEPALNVNVPDLTGTLGQGWSLVFYDVLGEFFLRTWLEALSAPAPDDGAGGWNGDRYAFWRGPSGQYVFAAAIRWDTTDPNADGLEFANELGHGLSLNPDFTSVEGGIGNPGGVLSVTFKGPAGFLVVALSTTDGTGYVIGAPSTELAEDVMTKLADGVTTSPSPDPKPLPTPTPTPLVAPTPSPTAPALTATPAPNQVPTPTSSLTPTGTAVAPTPSATPVPWSGIAIRDDGDANRTSLNGPGFNLIVPAGARQQFHLSDPALPLKKEMRVRFKVHGSGEPGIDVPANVLWHDQQRTFRGDGVNPGWITVFRSSGTDPLSFDIVYEVAVCPDGTAAGVEQCDSSAPQAPSQPRNVQVAGGDGHIIVTWDVPATDGGAPLDQYTIHLLDQDGAPVRGAFVHPPQLSVDLGPFGPCSYSFRVAVFADNGVGLSLPSVLSTPVWSTAPSELSGRLVGTVFQPDGVTPVAFPSINVVGPCAYLIQGDQDGRYSLENLAPGGYTVHVYSRGNFTDEWYKDKPSHTTADSIAVGGGKTSEANVVMDLGGTIKGRATIRGISVIPYGAGVAIFAEDCCSTSRPLEPYGDGSYGALLRPGRYKIQLHVSQPGGSYVRWYDDKATKAEAAWITVVAGETISGIDIEVDVNDPNQKGCIGC